MYFPRKFREMHTLLGAVTLSELFCFSSEKGCTMCIDIVEIWFGIANGLITSIFKLSANHTIMAWYYHFTFYLCHVFCSAAFLTILTLNIGTKIGKPNFYHSCPKILLIPFYYLLICIIKCWISGRECRPWSEATGCKSVDITQGT